MKALSRSLKLSLVLLIPATFTIFVLNSCYEDTIIIGRLSFNSQSLPSHDYILGDFIVQWQVNHGGTLSIKPSTHPDKLLWQSVPGKSFIAAVQGNETVSGTRGFYDIKDSWQIVNADQSIDSIEIIDGVLELKGKLTGGETETLYVLKLTQVNQADLSFTIEFSDPAFNRVFFTYASDRDEHFLGFGEQFSFCDFKGKRLPIFCTEKGIGRGLQPLTLGANLQAGAGGTWYTTYLGVPHYITSRMRSLFLENYEYNVFDMRRDDLVQVQVWSPKMTGHILNGDTPAALIKAYTDYSGRMRALPDWKISGVAIGGPPPHGELYDEVSQELESRGTPVIEYSAADWSGFRVTSFGLQLWWQWEVDPEVYPNWDELISGLAAKGISVSLYINPYLVDVTEKGHYTRNFLKEAEDNGYVVKNREGGTYMVQLAAFEAAVVDLSNPAAYNWLKEIIKTQIIGSGAKGWMADYGEALPADAVLYSGESAFDYHNRYPELWAKLNREAVQEAGMDDELVFWLRAGYTRSPAYATRFFAGDQLVSWDAYDGIKTGVMAVVNGGLSGFTFNATGVGGYTTITNPLATYHRSKELLLRWMELGAFMPFYGIGWGLLPDVNAQFWTDEETYAQFDFTAKLYVAWKDYRKQLVQEAAATGMPILRHPFIHYPNDPEVYKISYQQYMVGSEFMFAPVLDEGKQEVSIYLPAGEWVHAWSGTTYGDVNRGIYVTVAAPIGRPAIFFKAGSPVGEAFRYAIFEIH